MKQFRNDNRLVAPLALIAILFCGLTVVRVVNTSRNVPKMIRSQTQTPPTTPIAPQTNMVAHGTPAPITMRRATRDPYYSNVLLKPGGGGDGGGEIKPAKPGELKSTIAPQAFAPGGPIELPPVDNGWFKASAVSQDSRRAKADVEPVKSTVAPPEPPNYKLIAVFDGHPALAMLQGPNGETINVRVGSILPDEDGTRVTAISHRYIVVVSKKLVWRLGLEDSEGERPGENK